MSIRIPASLVTLTCVVFACLMPLLANGVMVGEESAREGESQERSVVDSEAFKELNLAWGAYLQGLQGQVQGGSGFLLNQVLEQRDDMGLGNLFHHSDVLVRYGERAGREGKTEVAISLLKGAMSLAPSNPAPHWSMVRLAWSESLLGVGERLRITVEAVRKSMDYIPERMRLSARFSAWWMTLVCCVFLLALFVFLIRYLSLFAQDIADRLPSGATHFHGFVALWILMLAPVAFRVDLLMVGFIWFGAVVLYVSTRERIVLGLLLLGLVCVAHVNDWTQRQLEASTGDEMTVYLCSTGACSPQDLKDLEEIAGSSEGGLAQEVLARHYVREYQKSRLNREQVDMHLARSFPVAPNKGVIHTLEGNTLFARFGSECQQGRAEASSTRRLAIQAWENALVADPNSAEASYNLGVAYRIAGSGDEASAYYADARRVNEESVTAFEQANSEQRILSVCPGNFNGNRYLMQPGPIWRGLGTREEEQTTEGLLIPFGGLLLDGQNIGHLVPLSLVCLVMLLLMWFLRRVINTAWFCGSCEMVSSGMTEAEYSHLGICKSCVSRRVKGTLWDPKASFFAARQQERSRNRRRGFFRGVAYLMPGWGDLLMGRPIRGFVMLSLFLGLTLPAVLWFPGELPTAGTFVATSLLTPVGLLCGGILFFLNIIGVYGLSRGGR